MNCDVNHVPTVGIMSQIMHMSMNRARLLFDEYDLKIGQAGILFMLEHFGEMSQRELASKMNVTPPSITAAIGRWNVWDTSGVSRMIKTRELCV